MFYFKIAINRNDFAKVPILVHFEVNREVMSISLTLVLFLIYVI